MPKARSNTFVGSSRAKGYYTAVKILHGSAPISARNRYPLNIPAIANTETLPLDPCISIIIGENGAGKSTLIEAMAVAAGFNAEGGSKNFRFETRSTESVLHEYIEMVRGARKEADGYFLRAECMYNVATQLEKLDAYKAPGPKLTASYGGTSLHNQSHGESFFSVVSNRFGADSFYILDEPESALSPIRQLYLLGQMHNLIEKKACQFIMATHSPILMNYPGALVYRLSKTGIDVVIPKETDQYSIYRDFMYDHKSYTKKLFDEWDKANPPNKLAKRKTAKSFGKTN